MITQFHIENFKGHRDTKLALKQLTLLVGDNGSGKTSVLEALELPDKLLAMNSGVQQSLDHKEVVRRNEANALEVRGLLRTEIEQMRLSFEGQARGQPWSVSVGFTAPGAVVEGRVAHPDWLLSADRAFGSASPNQQSYLMNSEGVRSALWDVADLMGHAAFYQFHAAQVAAGAYSDQPGTVVAADGSQTAVVLADLKLADDEAFNRIESAMRRLVPSLQRIRLQPTEVLHPSNPNPVLGRKLYFDFVGAKNVPAQHASQGTLVVLALFTVLYGRNRPRLILLDDFDHSLHPRAQMELIRMIKQLLDLEDFQETQIVLTTHSPYVLDEVSPENVIAFALRDDGTVAAKSLVEHPDAPKANGSLKPGELWSLDPEHDWVL